MLSGLTFIILVWGPTARFLVKEKSEIAHVLFWGVVVVFCHIWGTKGLFLALDSGSLLAGVIKPRLTVYKANSITTILSFQLWLPVFCFGAAFSSAQG